jgi:hypothetical protein
MYKTRVAAQHTTSSRSTGVRDHIWVRICEDNCSRHSALDVLCSVVLSTASPLKTDFVLQQAARYVLGADDVVLAPTHGTKSCPGTTAFTVRYIQYTTGIEGPPSVARVRRLGSTRCSLAPDAQPRRFSTSGSPDGSVKLECRIPVSVGTNGAVHFPI